jgi:D-beta-D-heptose 7-phosphate kinase/D-beta-D-heptose 1-phosphate adenosyltransferase
MTIVLVTGGFDPIHSGHIEYFKEAAQHGDLVVVGLNSDEWLTRKKGQPFMSFAERKAVIETLWMVDEVIAFDDTDNTACKAIEYLLEDPNISIIFANGGDRTNTSTPEYERFKDNPRVEFAWGVGGRDKKNSSSWVLDNWKNAKTIRPWGWYRVLDDKDGYKVKELVIQPSQSLSDQRHMLRNEHWYVLSGCCKIDIESLHFRKTFELYQLSEGLDIPVNTWHRAYNDTDKPCHILEVQFGSKCVEDDIERR